MVNSFEYKIVKDTRDKKSWTSSHTTTNRLEKNINGSR